jgi:hypothetical protein
MHLPGAQWAFVEAREGRREGRGREGRERGGRVRQGEVRQLCQATWGREINKPVLDLKTLTIYS